MDRIQRLFQAQAQAQGGGGPAADAPVVDTYAARRSGLRALRAQASRAPCAQANEPRLRPRQSIATTATA